MTIDNAIIHYYPMLPYIAKADVHLRYGSKIVLKAVLRDDDAAMDFLRRRFPDVPARTITHC